MPQRHLYLRDLSTANRRPVGCLVVELDRAKSEIRYAFSACSPRDRFDARIAQAIARGRLASHPHIIIGEVPKTGHEITSRIMHHIVSSNEEQGKDKYRSAIAYESAQAWLEEAAKPRSQAAAF